MAGLLLGMLFLPLAPVAVIVGSWRGGGVGVVCREKSRKMKDAATREMSVVKLMVLGCRTFQAPSSRCDRTQQASSTASVHDASDSSAPNKRQR